MLLVIGILLMLAGIVFQIKRIEISTQNLSIFSMGLILLSLFLFNPTKIKYGDLEVMKKIETIEQSLTEYIVVHLPETKDQELNMSKGIKLLKETVKDGDVAIEPFNNHDRGFKLILNFDPLFIRVNGEKASDWDIVENLGNCCSYNIRWAGGTSSGDGLDQENVFIEVIRR